MDRSVSKRKKSYNSYCVGVYNVHPYIFLNYNRDIDSLLILAHELGHAIHYYIMNKNLPFRYTEFDSFIGEVPALLSEILVLDYLYNDKKYSTYKKSIINKKIEFIKYNIYNIGLEQEYVERIMRCNNEINKQTLDKIWADINTDYYGKKYKLNHFNKSSWNKTKNLFDDLSNCKYMISSYLAFKIYFNIKDGNKEYLKLLINAFSMEAKELLKQYNLSSNSEYYLKAIFYEFNKNIDEYRILECVKKSL